MPSIALLAAGLALASASAPAPIPLGRGALPLEASLEVRTARRATSAALAFGPAADGSLTAHAEADEWEAWVVLAPSPGGARALSVRVLWRTPAEEQRVALSLAWPGAPSAVDRGLRYAPLPASGALRVERGTPLLVRAGAAVLAGGPGLAAARLERAGGGVRATLYLDDAAARPFSTFTTCFPRLPLPDPGQHLSWGSFDPRRDHPYAPRAAGQEDRLEAQLFPVADGAAFLPVVLERWPRGARAAVVFTDHADRTDADALRAVLRGDSDPAAHGTAGFLGHGVALTRTFFVHGRGGLEEPAVAALADDLVRHGSEVGLHSITADRDDVAAVRRGLADAARWRPVTWIDHEPYTNCEALSAQGWQASGPFGIREVLVEGGIRWVWAAGDEGPGQPRIDDLLGGRPDEARAAIAPFALDPRLWTFRSSMFYAPPGVLAAALSDAALQKLEDARGLFVAHTYLGPSARTTRSPEHLPRLAVHTAVPGEASRGAAARLAIDPALDAALGRIEAHAREGRLASLTWRDAGERLRALGDVELGYLPDGAVEVRNRGAVDLPGLTLTAPIPPEAELTLEGAGDLTRVDVQGGARLWFDLPAGRRAVLRATDHLLPLPFLPFP